MAVGGEGSREKQTSLVGRVYQLSNGEEEKEMPDEEDRCASVRPSVRRVTSIEIEDS